MREDLADEVEDELGGVGVDAGHDGGGVRELVFFEEAI